MWVKVCLLSFSLLSFELFANALLNNFKALYSQDLVSFSACKQSETYIYRLCSENLKNEGNAPYFMYHDEPTEKVVVLLHGLSDSPYYFRSIANALFNAGHNVIVALVPGHGKKDADEDITDPNLQQRWDQHASGLMEFAKQLGKKRYIGGFSTGGAIATHYVLAHPNQASGLMLFSGALQLQDDVEFMAKIWGIKWLAKWMEGEYDEFGANPYKYSKVHGYSAMVLMDEIFAIRKLVEQGTALSLPLFIAHSEADVTTLLSGVDWLAEQNQGATTRFTIPLDVDVCHADIVLDEQQIADMNFDASKLENPDKKCWVPQANPRHAELLNKTVGFVNSN